MYDRNPVYPHYEDLFWAHEPFKTVYVLQRVLTTMLLVPCWVIYYGILPKRFRPRPSWSIKQIIVVKFMKRVSRVTEVAGVTWGTRDPAKAPEEGSLKETRFMWAPALPFELRTGIVADDDVQCMPTGTYIWPKEPHPSVRMRNEPEKPSPAENKPTPTPMPDDLESAAVDAPPRMIGIYLHGGGYCHYSAHESSGTSRVPRRLIKDGLFQEIHAVEYRLLQHAPIPGAIQDAAAVYANIVVNQLGATKGPDGKYRYPTPSLRSQAYLEPDNVLPDGQISRMGPSTLNRAEEHAQATGQRPDPVPLTDSAPASASSSSLPSENRNARESVQPMLSGNDAIPASARSPSSSPPTSATNTNGPVQPMLSGNDAIPTITVTADSSSTIFTEATPAQTPDSRAPEPKSRHRTKIILIGDSAGGNIVLALARWIRDEGVLPEPDGMLLLSPSCDPSHTLPQVPASRRPRPHEATDYLLDTPEPRALLSRTFLGSHPPEFVYSPYVSPSSEWVLSVFHGQEGRGELERLDDIAAGDDSRNYREGPNDVAACDPLTVRPAAPGRTASTNPWIRDPSGLGLFTRFPRALIAVGDAERLEREVVALEKGMERDGVRVRMVWAKDGVHDLLILAYWDEKVREGIWTEIAKWVKEVENDP